MEKAGEPFMKSRRVKVFMVNLLNVPPALHYFSAMIWTVCIRAGPSASTRVTVGGPNGKGEVQHIGESNRVLGLLPRFIYHVF
jgi:hypothetical protein